MRWSNCHYSSHMYGKNFCFIWPNRCCLLTKTLPIPCSDKKLCPQQSAPHLCFSIAWSAEPWNLDIRKLNKNIWRIHQRISHNSPVNYHWILMPLADAVIALFGYQKEHQIVHISSSTHSWGWMEERYFAIIVCDNYYACYLNFLFVTNLWSDLLLFVGDRILYPKKGSAITWG